MTRFSFSLALCSALIMGCSAEQSESSDRAALDAVMEVANVEPDNQALVRQIDFNPDGVTTITWEDLLPEGEEEILEKLYIEFYQEFEARLREQQSALSSSLSSAGDVDISMIEEGSDADTMQQIGTFNVVEDLDGQKVRLPGYIVPLDFKADAEHTEFLLVPYFGACLHSPPPPPNQIVFVTSNPPAKIPDIYDPVWLEGTMTTGQFNTEMGNSAYELSLSKLEPYEY